MHCAAAALLSATTVVLIRKKTDERAEEERAETAAQTIGLLQSGVLDQMEDELLSQVLRFGIRVAARPNELMQGSPVTAAKFFKGLACGRFAREGSPGQETPLSGWKVHRRSSNIQRLCCELPSEFRVGKSKWKQLVLQKEWNPEAQRPYRRPKGALRGAWTEGRATAPRA